MEICPKRAADVRGDTAKCLADYEMGGRTCNLCLSLQSTKAILHFCRGRSRLTDGAISVRFFASTTRLLAGQKSAYKPVLKCFQFLCGCSKIASASPLLGAFANLRMSAALSLHFKRPPKKRANDDCKTAFLSVFVFLEISTRGSFESVGAASVRSDGTCSTLFSSSNASFRDCSTDSA